MRWLVFVSSVACAFAQSDPGTIHGIVLDQHHGVAGAPVEAKNAQTGAIYKTTSLAGGTYSLEQLAAGQYEITVGVAGFEKNTVTVQPAQVASADFHFQPDFQLGTLGDGDIYSRIAQLYKPAPPAGVTPRTREGKPDLSGVWRAPKTTESNEPELLPKAEQILNERFANNALDSPAVRCMPDAILRLSPFFRLLHTPIVLMVVIEAETPGLLSSFSGWPRPSERLWSSLVWARDGSMGRGHPGRGHCRIQPAPLAHDLWHTDFGKAARDERFQRSDLGHLQIETTIDDPEIYPKPWTMKRIADLAPSEEIMESVCNENNKDPQHMVGK
jgi:hypothetical protein